LPITPDVTAKRLPRTAMVFQRPLDVTLSGLAIETLLPADPETAAALQHDPEKW
jgi:hypothetical protein